MSVIREPDTPAARAVQEVAAEYCSPSLRNHCARSYIFARERGLTTGMEFDDELLYVAAMLHDHGLTAPFDSHTVPFEYAGGHVAWVMAAGAGWPRSRRDRLAEIIVRHMWGEVSSNEDPEGHLLAYATALDISGREVHTLSPSVLAEVLRVYPRLDLVAEFGAAMVGQAERKPGCSAASFVSGRGIDRLRSNPLNDMT